MHHRDPLSSYIIFILIFLLLLRCFMHTCYYIFIWLLCACGFLLRVSVWPKGWKEENRFGFVSHQVKSKNGIDHLRTSILVMQSGS